MKRAAAVLAAVVSLGTIACGAAEATGHPVGTVVLGSVPGDYDGDGRADLAVWRPSNGTWYVRGVSTTAYGASTDKPVPADYDGDGRTDVAVWRPSNGSWYVRGQSAVQFGASGDVSVPADYDGDGRADMAVWRPSNGTWYIRGISTTAYGASTDRTVPADYNGDGRADIAVWRPSNGSWYDRGQSAVQFGASGDIPVSVLPFDWIYPFRYAFPIQGCTVSYGHTHHDYPATDIFAARGCAVVSPVTGRIDEVSTVDRWNPSTNKGAGLAISIVGDDGVRYYGSHLSAITSGIRPGARVLAGQPIGRVGNTGSARGISTHLHFGLSWPTPPGFWWIRRGEVYPWPYLDAWRAGHNSSPAPAVEAERARQGTTPPCRVYC